MRSFDPQRVSAAHESDQRNCHRWLVDTVERLRKMLRRDFSLCLVSYGPTSTRSRVVTYQRPRAITTLSDRECRSGDSPFRLSCGMHST
jgi:hypothetical protein